MTVCRDPLSPVTSKRTLPFSYNFGRHERLPCNTTLSNLAGCHNLDEHLEVASRLWLVILLATSPRNTSVVQEGAGLDTCCRPHLLHAASAAVSTTLAVTTRAAGPELRRNEVLCHHRI